MTARQLEVIEEQRNMPRRGGHPGYRHLRDNIVLTTARARYLATARRIVRQHFTLLPGHTVHHIDGDGFNNALWNLMVFATSRDHTKFHHGHAVEPVFMGIWAGMAG